MGKRKSKKDRQLLLRWVAALTGALALTVGMAYALKSNTAPTLPASNPYGPEDFAYEGDYLTCIAGESRLGIDVSSHQGWIDWDQVKAAGVEFAIIRLGYRGYETGLLHEDEYARRNLADAKAAGLQVGAYFFSQALTPEEAEAEAKLALQILDGTTLDLPLAYDWEYVADSARTGGMEPDTLSACVTAFCDTVKAAGRAPMLYFNPDLASTLLDVTAFTELPYWLAMYSGEMTYPYKVLLWQYTDEGTVPGIEGNVDINLYLS